MILTQQEVAGYAQQAGLSGNALNIATAIAMAESGGNTQVINPGSPTDNEYSVGLWQINLRAHPEYTVSQMIDPVKNANAMMAISSRGTNWYPWGTFTSGKYLQFMGVTTTPHPVIQPPQTGGGSSNVTLMSTQTGVGPTQVFNLSSTITGTPDVVSVQGSDFKFILAYIIAIAIFSFMAQFRFGYNLIYWSLVLCVILLFVTQSRFIVNALNPISQNG